MSKLLLGLMFVTLSLDVFAQTDAEAAASTEPAQTAQEKLPAAKSKNSANTAAKTGEKMVDSATINLRTTVTGSQEQPRVLYIMPWQSPETPEMGIQTLSSQADAVFGHIEREELLRKLESSGELDSSEDSQ